jgi:16S rRNA processing protein RimM
MSLDDLFELGYVEKAHGLNGEISIVIDADQPEIYSEMESVFIEMDGAPIPFFVEALSLNGERGILALEEITSRHEAEQLKGKKLFLPLEKLPNLGSDQFYYHEIIGYQVLDPAGTLIGSVENVFDMPGDDLLSVKRSGKEVLIPINDAFLKTVDKNNRLLVVELPDGFLEIYTHED